MSDSSHMVRLDVSLNVSLFAFFSTHFTSEHCSCLLPDVHTSLGGLHHGFDLIIKLVDLRTHQLAHLVGDFHIGTVLFVSASKFCLG